jgi:hypothetical protein
MSIKVKVKVDRRAATMLRGRIAMVAGLHEVTEHVLAEANKTVPLETGTLQRSGFTEVDGKTLEGQVAYDTPYAVKQHEDPDLRHDPPRRDHWLERTADEQQAKLTAYMAKRVRDAMGG